MDWLRRLCAPSRRGTLTLLDRGIIVGFPPDEASRSEAERLHRYLEAWLAEGRTKPLILPWPVDVTDHRTKLTL